MGVSDCEYDAVEHAFPLNSDQKFVGWNNRLAALSSSEVSIREATELVQDGRRMRDMQLVCERMAILPVKVNASTITERLVLLAEVDGVHVGFCVTSTGLQEQDPLFIREIAVVPEARGRGIGMALLCAAAEREPQRDIALATQDNNVAAREMNGKFANSIGASLQRVNLGTYRDSDLSIQRGDGYRSWVIQRRPLEP